ncbi:exopolyphosphatase [Alginatibacterium sediminis]|uniref:Exopolyphosphatase n=1 Tax=Alginatibacterium sediminis TaxID=2164068 RepID=A0A420ENJ8_9ALTE|nr:exopolyphosphatase [Alginatibacterium sediminis]RKF22248.1 exopolyphosphatase [Alginatibacterium sediminis]
MSNNSYRLVTRSDFDGLVCAVLLKQLNLIDEITFVHPKDMQDGKVQITSQDIVTNLPYVEQAHLVFDHHSSEALRNTGNRDNHILIPEAPSAARVVWEHYGGTDTFPEQWLAMMEAVDKGDSAQFNRDEVLNPDGWNLLNFLMDARTGLGRFREFRVSNYNLMMDLIEYCKNHTIEEILALPDVQERVDLYRSHEQKFKDQILRCAHEYNNLVVLDLCDEEVIYSGNRFMVYALFPQCNISIHKMWGFRQQNIVFATGKSIFDRGSKTNVGELMLKYGGGGHNAAGTCQIATAESEQVLTDLINTINNDG